MEGYRIFLANGDTTQFGNINCVGLTQLTAHTFATFEQAVDHINASPNIQEGPEFIIMPVYVHRKEKKR